MARSEARRWAGAPGGAGPLIDPLRAAKLHRPPTRRDWVERRRLLALLDNAATRPVVLVAAPAGYGKTTLVAQWLGSKESSGVGAWISLDAGDNDPMRLWTDVAVALEAAGCRLGFDVGTFMAVNGREIVAKVIPGLLSAMSATRDDVTIVLDDFHLVRNVDCHDQVQFLIEQLPRNAHLLIATRADPGLRLARHRASGRLAEVRAAELAFTHEEASALLVREDVHLPDDVVSGLMRRTEGWPAAVYLVALSLGGRTDADEFAQEVTHASRFIGDFLTEEVLAQLTPEIREFVTMVSLVDCFCAPLCDFMTGTTVSAGILHDLQDSNLFLVPLDEKHTWFRFHPLFASVARAELEVNHPERVPMLHAKAAEWFRNQGLIDEAVEHSLASDDTNEAAKLIQANWLRYVGAGRTATVQRWLDRLGESFIATEPTARVTAAWMAAMSGDVEAVSNHLAALRDMKDQGPLPDGSHSVASAIGMIQGVYGYGGPVEMTSGAQRALELETDERTPFYSITQMARGHAAYIAGDLDLAWTLLMKAAHNEVAPPIIQLLSLSASSLVAFERGQLQLSGELAAQAMEVLDANGLRTMPQASMAFTALAQCQAAAGDLNAAVATAEQGLAMRRTNPGQGPWPVLHHLMVTARIAVQTGDRSKAQLLLHEVSDRMDHYSDGMGAMRDRLQAVRDSLGTPTVAPGRESLTDRELDVLRLLQGSLSLAEIAGELYITPNTVKTHAKAVYRKLGVSSRPEAVRIARGHL